MSNFLSTTAELRYGDAIARRTGGAHYVVDTSRDGRGPAAQSAAPTWCNPPGRGLGHLPTTRTASRYADAYLWIKHPGESDGSCHPGDPATGQWFDSYALGLIARRSH